MFMRWTAIAFAAFLAISVEVAEARATLRVSPVLLDVQAPSAAATVRLWNESDAPINVQLRLFRWTQSNGEDVLTPADGVAVSPPVTTLQPGSENVIRVVRTSKAMVTREESYRLIVDELPDPERQRPGTVTMLMRHSIPVFFGPPQRGGAQVRWSASSQAGGMLLTARNDGATRLRIADLVLTHAGRTVAEQQGLLGYVLGGSSASWLIPTTVPAPPGGPLNLSATSETGPIDAVASREGG